MKSINLLYLRLVLKLLRFMKSGGIVIKGWKVKINLYNYFANNFI